MWSIRNMVCPRPGWVVLGETRSSGKFPAHDMWVFMSLPPQTNLRSHNNSMIMWILELPWWNLEPLLCQNPTLNPACVLPQDQRSDPKAKSDLGEMPWINRGIALGAPTAENEMLQFSSGGYSRNDHNHFVFLLGSIQAAPMGSCVSTGSVKSLLLLPTPFLHGLALQEAEKSCHQYPIVSQPLGTSQNHRQAVPKQLERFLLCFFTTRYPKSSCNS